VTADASAQITDLTVDDHACLTFGESEEAEAARTIAASRPVVLRCQPEIAAGFARVGVDDVPGVRLVSADG
jgi:hypothetical protein